MHPPSTSPATLPSRPSAWGSVGFAVCVAMLAAWTIWTALHGIANDWQWGHNGYNGAAFWNAARNSVRFGMVGQAQYHTALTPPPVDDIYTHHPMLLHAHLIGSYLLLGDAPWVGRLWPALYSIGVVGMLLVVLLRALPRWPALLAATLYATTPLPVVFANMIDHEQGCMFWLLVLLWSWHRWLTEGQRKRDLALMLLAVSLAAQFDWPAYYFAFFLALHMAWRGLQDGGQLGLRWWQWRRAYTALGAFCVVVLANFVGFFAWIRSLRGGLGEMGSAFAGRSSSPDGYFARLWQRSQDLQGPVMLGLLALWLPLGVLRLVRRQAGFADLVAWLFFAVQLVHSLVFKQAGFIHCYWTYYAGPTLAIGGALVLWQSWRWLTAPLGRLRYGQRLATALALVMAAGLLVVQVPFARAKLRWGVEAGSGSYVTPYDPTLDEARFAVRLHQRFGRAGTHYLWHTSLQGRIEVGALLDTGYTTKSNFVIFPGDVRPKMRTVLLADLSRVQDVAPLRKLAAEHPTLVWDRRFIAVEVSAQGGKLTSFLAEPLPPQWWWSWLVHPDRPPVAWQQERPAPTLDALLTPTHPVVATPEAGGTGGQVQRHDCPPGTALAGLDVRASTAGGSKGPPHLVAAVTPLCQRLVVRNGVAQPEGPLLPGPAFGDQSAPWLRQYRCGDNEVVVGVHGAAGELVDRLGIVCAAPGRLQPGADGTPPRGSWTHTRSTGSVGGNGGKPFRAVCPAGSVAWSWRGRGAALVDRVGLACGPLPLHEPQ